MIELHEVLTWPCTDCPHLGGGHLPSAVAPFGRGACRDVHCGCARFTARSATENEIICWAPYTQQPGSRYGLVWHQSDWPPTFPHRFEPPRLITELPTVEETVYRLVGHHLTHRPDPIYACYQVNPAYFYADWGGGPHSSVDEAGIWIHRCGCRATFHRIGETELPGITAAMAPLLAWTTTNTTRYDRVELVPLLPPSSTDQSAGTNGIATADT